MPATTNINRGTGDNDLKDTWTLVHSSTSDDTIVS